MKKQFIVTIEMPEDANIPEAAGYIRNAIKIWKGQCHPEDPMSNLKHKSVTVKPVVITNKGGKVEQFVIAKGVACRCCKKKKVLKNGIIFKCHSCGYYW